MATSIINGQVVHSWQSASRGISVIGQLKAYETYAELAADNVKGTLAWVADATGDPSVQSGAALYRCVGDKLIKIYEEESMESSEKIALINTNIDTILSKLGDVTDAQLNIVFCNSGNVACEIGKWYIPEGNNCKLILPTTDVEKGSIIKVTVEADYISHNNTGTQFIGIVNGVENMFIDVPETITLMYREGWKIIERSTI